MRYLALTIVVAVLVAAAVSIGATLQPFRPLPFLATVLLAVGVVVQRISVVHKWLSTSRNRRKEGADILAQQALVDLCNGRTVTPELLELSVHVWEVPQWYRRIFPFALRDSLKRLIASKRSRLLTHWTLRPSLQRVAAVGLTKPTPSGVRFRKGLGLVGVCVANNHRNQLVTLRTASTKYKRALESETEEEWSAYGPGITHNLSLADARKLSHSYGQVIARVVQDPASGEAIGCVTISLTAKSLRTLQITSDPSCKRIVTDLAISVAIVIA